MFANAVILLPKIVLITSHCIVVIPLQPTLWQSVMSQMFIIIFIKDASDPWPSPLVLFTSICEH